MPSHFQGSRLSRRYALSAASYISQGYKIPIETIPINVLEALACGIIPLRELSAMLMSVGGVDILSPQYLQGVLELAELYENETERASAFTFLLKSFGALHLFAAKQIQKSKLQDGAK